MSLGAEGWWVMGVPHIVVTIIVLLALRPIVFAIWPDKGDKR